MLLATWLFGRLGVRGNCEGPVLFCTDLIPGTRHEIPHDEEGIMADPKINKHKEYVRYANHCLEMVLMAKDQESRSIQREMAGEWLRLADTLIAHHPVKPRGRQPARRAGTNA